MSKGFALKDLYDLISVNANISYRTAEKVWNTILNIIVSELEYNDKISIENFGTFVKTYQGGKDEYFNDELGIVHKAYVPPTVNTKFTPSRNFVERLNKGVEERIGKYKDTHDEEDYYESILLNKDFEQTLSDSMDLALARRSKRREKERVREKKYQAQSKGLIENNNKKNIFQGQPIKCLTNNKVYPSMSKCARDLDLRIANIKKSLETKEPLFGYTFELITNEEYMEEIGNNVNEA